MLTSVAHMAVLNHDRREHHSEIKDRGYICLIDEEVGVIDSFNAYSSDDLQHVLKNERYRRF